MAVNKNVPAIRFKLFEDDWAESALIHLTSLITKGTTPLSKSGNGNINFIKIENINPSNGIIESTSKITEEEHKGYLKRSQLKANDILFSIAGTLGRVSTVRKELLPANTNQALAIIRLKDASHGFVSTFLKGRAITDYVKKNPTVGAQPNLSLLQVSNFDIAIPSPAEQTQIGNYFKELDGLIQLQEQKLKKITNLKKAMLEKMFPKEGADVPEIRFKGFTEKWEELPVKKLCSISTGKSNTQDRKPDGKFPFYVRSAIVEKSNRFLFEEEAVLTVGDGVGTGKVFHYVNGKYDLHQRVYRMFDFQDILGKYFYYIFSKSFYKRVMSMTAKTSVDSVRLEMISEMKVKRPCIKEQRSIVNYFDNLDQLISQSQQKIKKLKHLKQALLQKMFI